MATCTYVLEANQLYENCGRHEHCTAQMTTMYIVLPGCSRGNADCTKGSVHTGDIIRLISSEDLTSIVRRQGSLRIRTIRRSASGHCIDSKLRPCTMLSGSIDNCLRVLSSGRRPRFRASCKCKLPSSAFGMLTRFGASYNFVSALGGPRCVMLQSLRRPHAELALTNACKMTGSNIDVPPTAALL